jgi:AraC-like DNA-binding protein
MVLSNDYLTLRPGRLNGSEKTEFNRRGLLFLILQDGAGDFHCGQLLHRLGPGDVLVVDSPTEGKIHVRGNREMVFCHFVAELEHLFPLFSGREICLLQNVAERFKSGRVYSGSSPLAKQCLGLAENAPIEFSLDHRSHLLRMVSAILTAEFDAVQLGPAKAVPMRDHVLQVFDRLHTDDLLSLSVGDLAKKFHCSRRHLNRLFHQHFGLSMAALRMEMRLLKAISLLADPDAKVIYVAEKCGFNHLGLFNACFKKRFGASPSHWRKMTNQADTHLAETPPTRHHIHGQSVRLPSKKNGASLEPLRLGALLREIVALKNAGEPQAYAPKEANGSRGANGSRHTAANGGAALTPKRKYFLFNGNAKV